MYIQNVMVTKRCVISKMRCIILSLFFVFVYSIESNLENSIINNFRINDIDGPKINSTKNDKCLTVVCKSNTSISDTSISVEEFNKWTMEMDASVPEDQIVQINFENCLMTNISSGIFEVFNRINILNASFMGLETLHDEFQEAKHLIKLNVSHNNIIELPPLLFTKAKSLAEVDFSFNKISHIDSSAFGDAANIEALTFAHNNIKLLPNGIFDHLSNLWQLNLSHNAITNLDARTFKMLKNLTSLDLSHNAITELSTNLLVSLNKLQYLNLAHLMLTTIKPMTFRRQTHLLTLDLSQNRLKELDIGIFDSGIFLSKFDNLQHLLIGGNRLKELNGFSSTQLPSVLIDGLDQNKFDCCYFNELFRLFDWKQLNLPFDFSTHHPNVSDSTGFKCSFGNSETSKGDSIMACNLTEWLMYICALLLALLIFMIILFVKNCFKRTEATDHFNTVIHGSPAQRPISCSSLTVFDRKEH